MQVDFKFGVTEPNSITFWIRIAVNTHSNVFMDALHEKFYLYLKLQSKKNLDPQFSMDFTPDFYTKIYCLILEKKKNIFQKPKI